jgi:polysaccharide biosynthesis transport protein
MSDPFDLYEYAAWLRSRWRFWLVACSVAVALALIVSLMLPKRYTAVASIMIEAPAGNDPRSSTAVSPMYLESLKTYEHFASSDSLFARALDQVHLRDSFGGAPIESVKRSVLKVSKLRDTRILEIHATLADPKQAQALVHYLAEETVNLNRSMAQQSDQDLARDPQAQLDSARAELAEARAASDRNLKEDVDTLRAEVESLGDLRSSARKQLVEARASEAEYASRAKTPADTRDTAEAEFVRRELTAVRARIVVLEGQTAELDRELNRKQALLSVRTGKRDELEARLKSATAAYETAAARLRDIRGNAGYRGERLQIVDPGIVPQRPSFPNHILHVGAALLLAVVICWAYLTAAFGFRRGARPVFRMAVGRDD